MAPFAAFQFSSQLFRRQSAGPVLNSQDDGDWRAAAQNNPEDLVLESWSQGFIVGALLVMACITVANMRKRVLLHKVILLELLLAMTHGTFCFMTFKGYGWYLSSTAALLYLSYIIHNVVAWMKVKPFFSQPGGFFRAKIGFWVTRVYLGSLALTVPVIIFQISDNFRYFNNRGGWYTRVRPYEPLMRDPWWVFTCITLFHIIQKCYGTGVIDIIKRSPRFGIMLTAITLSIIFTILDIVASIHSITGSTDGINPWWKLSLVFKCLTDTIMLDDFKTELKRLGIKRIEKEEARRNSVALVTEYPSGLDDPDPTRYSQPRRDTLFRFNHSPLGSKTFGSDSTVVQQEPKDARDEDEDPLSEYAAQRESQNQQNKHGASSSHVQMEEVEFANALTLDPIRMAGLESAQNDRLHERENIRISTKKIARLPKITHFRFEAIKPAKGSRRYSADTEGTNDDNNDGENEFAQTRNLAEEIQRNTIMDLEAQKRAKAARAMEHRAEGDSDSENEYKRRVNRFKHSIGAIE